MWLKNKLLPATVLIAAAGALSVNQAQAFDDDAAAVLVGVAVGGLTTYALQNANKHHHHHRGGYEYEYERRHYREPPRHHHRPVRVEHYVIHNPPQHRGGGYDRVGYGHDRGYHRGHHKGRDRHRGGYEYEYEYKRKSSF